jgi:hypothetical protein
MTVACGARSEIMHATATFYLGTIAEAFRTIWHEIRYPALAEAPLEFKRAPAEAVNARSSFSYECKVVREDGTAAAEGPPFLKRKTEHAGITACTGHKVSMPDIDAGRIRLQQIAINVVCNAADVMTDADGRSRVVTVPSNVIERQAIVAIAGTGMVSGARKEGAAVRCAIRHQGRAARIVAVALP